jgi:hypothetical protein
MLDTLKDRMATLATATNGLVDGIVERQINFVSNTLRGGLEASRQLRNSRSLGDVVSLQTAFLTDLQGQVVALGNANLAALRSFGSHAAELMQTPRRAAETTPPAKKPATA